MVDDAEICYFGVFGDFVPVDEKSSVSSLYVSDPLEKLSNFIFHALAPFEFLRALDEVLVLFCLSFPGEDDCIRSPWL